ncbi:hypothetical protein CICLE_v10030376mg [Citrus x clementina]|uniref:AP2/ERF domain-containing protein n=1 Tax=Citrus clementina TaxID=85681 RepID=V4SF48_CITCL|nr:hypothetical protein CICLE_v10030376mg [Citrus x clementina]
MAAAPNKPIAKRTAPETSLESRYEGIRDPFKSIRAWLSISVSPEDAARAYDAAAARCLRGSKAKTNFPLNISTISEENGGFHSIGPVISPAASSISSTAESCNSPRSANQVTPRLQREEKAVVESSCCGSN